MIGEGEYILGRPKYKRKLNLYKDFYLKGTLSDEDIVLLDKILEMKRVGSLKRVIPESAELFGRSCEDVVLLDAQTIPVAMARVNPYLFIGDKPGLGKTIMGAAVYAHYRKRCFEDKKPVGKLLVVTDNNHVRGIAYDFLRCGINLVPLYGGTVKIERDLKKFSLDDSLVDGIATSWDSLRTNGFLLYYLDNAEKFYMGIFDETSILKNDKNNIYASVDEIAKNFEQMVFLNASIFETCIFDMYNQLRILNPNIITTKKFIYDRYVIKGRRSWFESEYVKDAYGGVGVKRVQKFAYRVADYVNQEELKERLKYYYIARTKKDFSDELPSKTYRLHPVEMTGKMAKKLKVSSENYREILNSPTTLDKKETFNAKTVPKLGVVVDLFESIADERPVIYCFNTDAQVRIKGELRKKGYRVEIISGTENSGLEERERVLKDFSDGYYDGIIINVAKAINIYGSDAMIFYDTPTNPQITYQIMGRIDRNNYKDKKTYHFLVYLDSPEMFNMVELAHFREEHGSKFTGQYEDVYKQLIMQIEANLAGEEVGDESWRGVI